METLHVHGQDAWHDDVVVVGTLESLELLKIAIDLAIEGGYGKADLFCNDGEGYKVRVVKMTEDRIDKAPVPYSSDYACAPAGEFSDFMRMLLDRHPD